MAPIESYLTKTAGIEDGTAQNPLTRQNTSDGQHGGGYTFLHRILNASLERPGEPIYFKVNGKTATYTHETSHASFLEGVGRSTDIRLLLSLATVSASYNIALALNEISKAS